MSHIQTGADQSDDAEHDDAGHGQQDPDDGADLALHRRHSRGRSLRCRGLSGGSAQGRAALLTKSALNRGATTGAKSHEESGPPPDPPLYATEGRESMRWNRSLTVAPPTGAATVRERSSLQNLVQRNLDSRQQIAVDRLGLPGRRRHSF